MATKSKDQLTITEKQAAAINDFFITSDLETYIEAIDDVMQNALYYDQVPPLGEEFFSLRQIKRLITALNPRS